MAPLVHTIRPDEDRGSKLLAIYWTACSIGIIIVSLRFYARIKIRGLGLDDWTMLLAMVLVVVLATLATLTVAHGGARHLYYLHVSEVTAVLKLDWMIQPFGIMALAIAKISVAFVMLRIISSAAVWRRRFLYFCMISTFVISATGSVLNFVQCNPPRALWTFVPGATCWDPRIQIDFAIFSSSNGLCPTSGWQALMIGAGWNAFMDACLALLPVTIIWKLHMTIQKRLGLCILLGLGILAGISAAIKTTKLVALSARSDLTWATFDLFAWTTAELFCLVICGSLPTLKPLYDQILARKHPVTPCTSGRKPLGYPRAMQQAYLTQPPRHESPDFTASSLSADGNSEAKGNVSSFV